MTTRALAFTLLTILLWPLLPSGRHALVTTCAHPGRVTALANGPSNTLLLGTQAGGLYRSSDGGRCFAPLAPPPLRSAIGALLVPPGHPAWIIAGGNWLVPSTMSPHPGLYRSQDAGQTWADSTAGLPQGTVLPMQLAASSRGTLILAYRCANALAGQPGPPSQPCAGGLARSADGGRSWRPVGPRRATGVGVVARATGAFLAIVGSPLDASSPPRLYRSRDDGQTWQVVGTLPGDGRDIATVFAVPWDSTQVVAGYGIATFQPTVYRSTTGGARWMLAWHQARKAGIRR